MTKYNDADVKIKIEAMKGEIMRNNNIIEKDLETIWDNMIGDELI